MEIRVDTQRVNLPRRSISALRHRIGQAFERVGSGVRRLHITLKDINGPRGGRDKVCVLRAELADGGEVVVVDRSEKLRRALFRSLRRGRRLVRREAQRRQSMQRARANRRRTPWIPEPAA